MNPKVQRRQDIELLRVVAAFGIVWFHARAPGGQVAYAGLVVFLVLSTYLVRRGGNPPSLDSLRRRSRRLLLPWMVWFAVYGAFAFALRGVVLDTSNGYVAAVMSGTNIHLWYLPFTFLCLAAVDVLHAHVSAPTAAWLGGLSALGLTATAPIWRPATLAMPYPLLQWADALAPVAFGIFLQTAWALPRFARRILLFATIGAALLVAWSNSIGTSYAVGFVACAVIAAGNSARWSWLRIQPVADLSFGIYLCHIVILEALIRYGALDGVALPILTFALAAAVVAVGRKIAPRYRDHWS